MYDYLNNIDTHLYNTFLTNTHSIAFSFYFFGFLP